MGKEWLYWGSSGSNNSSGTSTKSNHRRKPSRGEEVTNNEEVTSPGCMCFQIFDLPHFQLALNQQSRSLKPHTPPFLQQEQVSSFLKGVEAPRNILDLDEPVMERKSVSSSLSSSTMKVVEEQNLNIPVGIQIRTSCDTKSPRVSMSSSRTRTDDISSECSSSPGTKTPTLVARLMGLDLLPENNSPRISISTFNNNNPPSKSQSLIAQKMIQSRSNSTRRFSNFESSDNINTGTLSLPETPRISSASRRSDVDYHHRLSLQINKENMGDVLEISASTARKMARGRKSYHQENENNRSPGYYARQIVKQVKESVSRKVGHDITNTVRSTKHDQNQVAKYDEVVLLKPKKPSKVLAKLHGDDDLSPIKQTTPSCSPRFRFLEPKSTKSVNSSAGKSQTSHSPRFSPLSPLPENPTLPQKVVTKPKPQSSPEEQVKQYYHVQQNSTIQRGKGEKCSLNTKKPPQASDAIRSKKEEPFVRSAAATNKANFTDKKCKKTPSLNQLANTTVPTILPLKKDPSPPPTKLLIKQESDTHPSKRSTQLSGNSSQYSYKQQQHNYTNVQEINRDRCNGAAISGDGAEFQYIQRILKRTGIDKSTPLSLAKWYSSSHPLDPSIFHHFELFHLPITTSFFTTPNSTLTLKCNRKLIFQLVDELLVEILKPYGNVKPWLTTTRRVQNCHQMHGKELIDTLCMRIQSFPSANCQVLEDIDALIDKDLLKTELGITSAFEDEVETIVFEIERDIMEELLVHETVYDVTM